MGVGGCGRVWAWVGVADSPRCVFPSSWMVLHVLFCRGEEPAELVSRPPSGRRHEARRPSQGDHHTGPQHHYHHYQHHNTLWGHYVAAATATAFCYYCFTDPRPAPARRPFPMDVETVPRPPAQPGRNLAVRLTGHPFPLVTFVPASHPSLIHVTHLNTNK